MDSLVILLLSTISIEVVFCSNIYHGQIAIPHVLHNGYLADTHEVAVAKRHHLALLNSQAHGNGYGDEESYGKGYSATYGDHQGHGDFRYHGPTAIPHVLHDGHIADTHEVAAAKAEHLAAVAKAKAHVAYRHDYSGRYAEGYGENSGAYHGYLQHVAPYHGPLAKPVVLKSGYLADTHEVAAAKHHHLAALTSQSYGHGYGKNYGYGENLGYSHGGTYANKIGHGDFRYHGPTAIPHVLHDGHIADTHEVAAAKHHHLAALTSQSYGHGYGKNYGYGENLGYSHGGTYANKIGHGDFRYHGPTAIPHVLHDGHIADTHEVAAAKAEHYAAIAKAKAHAGYGQDYSEIYTGGSGEHSGHY